jgi:hypothetical protein
VGRREVGVEGGGEAVTHQRDVFSAMVIGANAICTKDGGVGRAAVFGVLRRTLVL